MITAKRGSSPWDCSQENWWLSLIRVRGESTRIISMRKATQREQKPYPKATWQEFNQMTDADIDFSDIPELDEEFFKNAEIVDWPPSKSQLTIRLDMPTCSCVAQIQWPRAVPDPHQPHPSRVAMESQPKTRARKQDYFFAAFLNTPSPPSITNITFSVLHEYIVHRTSARPRDDVCPLPCLDRSQVFSNNPSSCASTDVPAFNASIGFMPTSHHLREFFRVASVRIDGGVRCLTRF